LETVFYFPILQKGVYYVMAENKPKIKIELEYPVNCSRRILFERLSSTAGLSEWFADDVKLMGDVYDFIWDKQSHPAQLIAIKDLKQVRFRWNESPADHYFEFRLVSEELSGSISLVVTDFVTEHEKAEAIHLWDTLIADLKRIIGT